MGSLNKEIEILSKEIEDRKNQKKGLELKMTITKMKNSLNKLSSQKEMIE